jgi:drug/metabolite transporter (DMT)-like permease
VTGWPLWWRLLLISSLWGAAFPAMRFAAAAIPPWWIASGRAALAACVVALWLALRDRPVLPRGGMLRHALVLGTLNGWVPNILASASLARIESAAAALIEASSPLLIALLAAVALPGERPGRRTLLGLAVGFAGIAVIAGPDVLEGGASGTGALLMLLVALSYACGTVYVRATRPGAADELAFGQQAVGGIVATLIAVAVEPGGPPMTAEVAAPWAAVAALAVFGSAIPLTLFLALAQRVRATDVATVGYLQPAFAAVFGALLLAEFPERRVLAGGAVVLAGVWLATRRRARLR